MTAVQPVRFDPFAYEVHEDPYPLYRRLRDDAPAYLDPEHGFWALSRDDDVRVALNDTATFSSSGGITLERRAEAVEPMLIETDPPRHTRLRGLVSRAFTPKRVADLEGPMRSLSVELIDAFRETERVDVIGEFAALLPMAVISEMLGVPRADQDALRGWSD
ncbi:MAG: cytochrome P450, partial [Acidimicrobiia bacterium]